MRIVLFFVFMLTVREALPDDLSTKHQVLALATSWKEEMARITNYGGLAHFCADVSSRRGVYSLLSEIHYYHALLYEELATTKDHHKDRTIRRILRHIEQIEAKYNIESFNDFFYQRCAAQQRLERHPDQYQSGFGVHSYKGKIHVLEVELHRYLMKLTRRIGKVKKHVHKLG